MGKAIVLRADHGAEELRRLARASRDATQTRRLLALAIHDGASRTEAARVGGVGLQIVRDWVMRFNAEGPTGLLDRKPPGKPSLLKVEQRAALAKAVEDGRGPSFMASCAGGLATSWAGCGTRSTSRAAPDGVPGSSPPVRGITRRTRRLSRRSKNLPAELEAIRAKLPPETAIELWWQEFAMEAGRRIRRRSKAHGGRARGSEERDHAPVGAAQDPAPCAARPAHRVGLHFRRDLPGEGQGRRPCDALRQHRGDAGAPRPNRRHERSGRACRPPARPGRHMSNHLVVPANITLLPLPPRSPELNPVENIWQYLRQNWLSNRIFEKDDDIVAHCCDAWNRLRAEPERITSLGHRDRAHRS